MTQSPRYLGDFVGWHLENRVSVGVAQKLAAQHELSDALSWPVKHVSSAYRRAVAQLAANGHEVTKTLENPLEVEHAVRSNDGREVCRVRFDKEIQVARCSAADGEIERAFFAEYGAQGGWYTAKDAGITFQRMFRSWGGVRMLSRGGWWFLPSQSADLVLRWARFLRDLGGKPIVVPQPSSRPTLVMLRAAVRRDLESQYGSHVTKLQRLDARARRVRPTTHKRISRDLLELRDRAHLHAQLLDCDLGEFKARCFELARKLGGVC